MIADAYGKLYIISANRQVFKVDIDTRVTTHIGTITGLPDNYTTNGAAVDADGNVVVSSAITFEGYFKFSMANLAAAKIEGSDKIYNASDLANGYLLYQKEADAKKNFGVSFFKPVAQLNSDAKVYPNPVTANEFKVLLDGQKSGQYTITLTDLSGRAVMVKQVLVSLKLQTLSVQLTRTVSKGIYLVKVTDTANKVVFIERIAVQ
jgi:hypothetical protein